MNLISADEILTEVDTVLSDTSITEAVTYKSVSSVSSTITLKTTETITPITTRANIAKYTDSEIRSSNGAIKGSDRIFLIRASALSAITPSVSDRINYDGRDWEIVGPIETVEVGGTKMFFSFQGR